jgi:hypothetical protein
VVQEMTTLGAKGTAAELRSVIDYLTQHYSK